MIDNAIIAAGMGILGILGGINVYILTGIQKDIRGVRTELQLKQDRTSCDANMKLCKETRAVKEQHTCGEIVTLWQAFDKHSHTGLPESSKVTR